MSIADVRKRLEGIAASAKFGYDEAHADEKRLWFDVLTAISAGQCQTDPPEDVAAEALRSEDVEFPRYYA